MRLQLPLVILFAVLWSSTGCNSSGGSGGGRSTTTPTGGADVPDGEAPDDGEAPGDDCPKSPVLQTIEGVEDEICTGARITLVGVNFATELSENEVLFRGANNVRMQGVPVEAVFPTDGDCRNGLESRLVVAVPGGVVSGDVELRVRGVLAGGFVYSACPQIMAYKLGRVGSRPSINWIDLPGIFDRNAFVRLIGINFESLAEIVLEDSQGTFARIPAENLVRSVSGVDVESGYSGVGFALSDETTEVRLLIEGPRDNVRVQAIGQSSVSNIIQVPVTVHDEPELVLNAVHVPPGAVSGGVRVRYSMYEEYVIAAYNMLVEWRPVTSTPDNPWFPAVPDADDPVHDGVEGILPGNFAQEVGHGLFPVRGKFRTFTWNPELDANFPPSGGQVGGVTQRVWPIEFRITPELAVGSRRPVTQMLVTPAILYVDLSDDAALAQERDQRMAVFVENFADTAGRDAAETTASWGDPSRSLEGALPSEGAVVDVFGQGTRDLVLRPPTLDAGSENVVQEFQFNTTSRRLTFVQRSLNEPLDPSDDVVQAVPVSLDDVPGEEAGEFHFRTLTIAANTLVRARGERPLVLRLAGTGNTEEPAFILEPGAVVDLSGEDGETAPHVILGRNTADFSPGLGGEAGAGGGEGGNGAEITIERSFNPTVKGVKEAGQGANSGGGGGETTTAIDFGLGETTNVSQVAGGPGGGGGNRLRGGDGDPGIPAPIEYAPPRGGRGGDAYGSPALLDLAAAAGSGGGGGGATLSGNRDGEFQPVGGPGGGGGGGAIGIVCDGSMLIQGRIEADGGAGGNGNRRIFPPGGSANGRATGEAAPGAGAGGSGGAILLQATGAIDVGCSQLSVEGGGAGLSGASPREVFAGFGDQNFVVGSGIGAPGWIRVEANVGGVPNCSVLRAETALAAPLVVGELEEIVVRSTEEFPPSGTLILEAFVVDVDTGQDVLAREEIGYSLVIFDERASEEKFARLRRAQGGVGPFEFRAGARVFLKTGLVPTIEGSVLSEGGLVRSSEGFPETGGAEGHLIFPYEPSFDDETGDPILDPATGQHLSIYPMDTGTGVITSPSGATFRASPANEPNVLDVLQLRIPAGVVLRATGSLPLEILAAEQVDIAGRIDVSGQDGGLLRFDPDRLTEPNPGTGGPGGAAGGNGGAGATIEHRDGDPTNAAAANTVAVVAGPGQLPANTPAEFFVADTPVGDGGREDELAPLGGAVVLPEGGATWHATGCRQGDEPTACDQSGGGGAGGGNRTGGARGGSVPAGTDLGGTAGDAFGMDSLRFRGEFWLSGGTGAGGGGASVNVPDDYRARRAGESLNQGRALFAPGTGGGGGGGVLHLVCGNLFIRSTGAIVARGGNAFQSIDLGGNGGAGAGGNVILQIRDTLTIDPGGTIDVSGGEANLPVPLVSGVGLPSYEGNLRLAGELIPTLRAFGGRGGDGAIGRIRIEVDENSLAADGSRSTPNSSWFAGRFYPNTFPSVAVSEPIHLGVGRSLVIGSPFLKLGAPIVVFDQNGRPGGTDSVVLWQGAGESLDVHGGAGPFSRATQDVKTLRDGEYVRFRVLFRSNAETGESPSIGSILLPYELSKPTPRLDDDGSDDNFIDDVF